MTTSWIYTDKNVTLDQLVNTLGVKNHNSKRLVVIFDVDGTLSNSPARRIVMEYSMEHSNDDFGWVVFNFLKRVIGGESVESEIWKSFIDSGRIEDPIVQQYIQSHYTPEKVRNEVYQELIPFLDSFQDGTSKIIVSRINGLIAEAYKTGLGFDEKFVQEFDKARAVVRYLKVNPQIHNAVIFGDTKEDRLMGEAAKSELGDNKVLLVCVTPLEFDKVTRYTTQGKFPPGLKPGFDVYIGNRHYGGAIALKHEVGNFMETRIDKEIRRYIGNAITVV